MRPALQKARIRGDRAAADGAVRSLEPGQGEVRQPNSQRWLSRPLAGFARTNQSGREDSKPPTLRSRKDALPFTIRHENHYDLGILLRASASKDLPGRRKNKGIAGYSARVRGNSVNYFRANYRFAGSRVGGFQHTLHLRPAKANATTAKRAQAFALSITDQRVISLRSPSAATRQTPSGES